MSEKRYFQLRDPYETVGELRNSLIKTVEMLGKINAEESLENLPEAIVNDVIFAAEKADLSLRCASEKQAEMQPEIITKDIDQQPVAITFDGRMLIVKTPLTLKRSGIEANDKHNYMLMNYVRAALEEWQDKHGLSLYKSIDWPVVAFIIRKGNGNKIRGICDNDNLENGRIINEIFGALGYSDNVLIMDLCSKYEPAESKVDIGTEFILVSKKEKEAINDILFGTRKVNSGA
jgi:hypothetical protein